MIQPLYTHEQIMRVRQMLEHAQSVVLLTHQNPDGDAMGSCLGMYHLISTCYAHSVRSVRMLIPSVYPNFLSWMPAADQMCVYQEDRAVEMREHILGADLVICTDFHEPKRIGALGLYLLERTKPIMVIDHHLGDSMSDDDAHLSMIFPQASSASELVTRLLLEMGVTLTDDMATCLYTGVMTDTGNFEYSSDDPELFKIVAELLKTGINKNAIYDHVFNSWTVDRLRFVGFCLHERLHIYPEYHAAMIALSRKDMYHFNVSSGDTEGIVNLPLKVSDIYYSCFIREDKILPHERERAGDAGTKLKISLRSQGDRPVNEFAHDVFSGGGHANAAGGEFFGEMKQAAQAFINALPKYCKK